MDVQFPLIQKRNTLRHVKIVSNKGSNEHPKTVTSYNFFLWKQKNSKSLTVWLSLYALYYPDFSG